VNERGHGDTAMINEKQGANGVHKVYVFQFNLDGRLEPQGHDDNTAPATGAS
jgi:hypothetical protein